MKCEHRIEKKLSRLSYFLTILGLYLAILTFSVRIVNPNFLDKILQLPFLFIYSMAQMGFHSKQPMSKIL